MLKTSVSYSTMIPFFRWNLGLINVITLCLPLIRPQNYIWCFIRNQGPTLHGQRVWQLPPNFFDTQIPCYRGNQSTIWIGECQAILWHVSRPPPPPPPPPHTHNSDLKPKLHLQITKLQNSTFSRNWDPNWIRWMSKRVVFPHIRYETPIPSFQGNQGFHWEWGMLWDVPKKTKFHIQRNLCPY